MSDFLRPHELQHARFPCPSLSLRDCSNSCSLSQWCHPTISSSVTPHLPLLSSLPASGSLPKVDFCIRWSKYWSFSLGLSSSSEYSELISFRIDWFDLFKVQGTLSWWWESSPAPQFKSINSSALSLLYGPTLISVHDYWKNHNFSIWTLVGKVMSLLFNIRSRVVIAFLPRSKHLLISWLKSPSAVILEPEKRKSITVSIVSPTIWHEVMGPNAMILIFWILSFEAPFHSPLSHSSRGSLVPLCFLPLGQ